MVEQKPRSSWIYMIDPKRVFLMCKFGHQDIYNISGPEELNCSHPSCNQKMNSSKVMRGNHPYIVWSELTYGKLHLYHAIPLTSKDTFRGLPTSYPIKVNPRNGLACSSLALVHQLTVIDANCFQDNNGNWIKRLGIINADEKKDLEERLRLALNLSESPSEDWFTQNASPDLLERVFMQLDPRQREEAISQLIDKLDS